MKKLIFITIATALVVGGASFYGGIKYSENKNPQSDFTQNDFRNMRNLSPEERQNRMQESGADLSTQRGNRIGAGMITGDIISKDEQSITVKLNDGGSKIIFYSDSSEIGKLVSGTLDDLKIGQSVVINGKTNQDGSVIAQLIQLR